MTHCLTSPFVENRALSHFTLLHTSGMDLPAVWKGMLPHVTSHECDPIAGDDMRSSAAPSSQLIKTMSSTQCCADFSSVLFLHDRRRKRQPREPSSANITTSGQKGCCAEVLPHLQGTTGFPWAPMSLAYEVREWERHSRVLFFFSVLFLKAGGAEERGLLHTLEQQH